MKLLGGLRSFDIRTLTQGCPRPVNGSAFMSVMKLGVVCGLLAISAGCSTLQEISIATKNKMWAQWAWMQDRGKYAEQPKPMFKHFGKGYRNGYYDVANGANGRTPLLPPVKYWGVKHQNPLGRDEIKAWFDGYQDGALAAEQDNVGYWMTIPLAPDYAPCTKTEILPPSENVLPGKPPGAPSVPEELPPAKGPDADKTPVTGTGEKPEVMAADVLPATPDDKVKASP
jgi:hypothetical protein